MKTPHLIASFAVAAMASAAELKHPAEVAREFNEATKPAPRVQSHGLLAPPALVDNPLPRVDDLRRAPRTRLPDVNPWGAIPRDKICDAPDLRVPEELPNTMPPGTKRWKYGTGTYYLLPLIPAREK